MILDGTLYFELANIGVGILVATQYKKWMRLIISHDISSFSWYMYNWFKDDLAE